MRDEVLAAFDFPWLSQFALAHLEPIDRGTAEAFVARFTGATLGEVLGDVPDSEAGPRLRAVAINAADEGHARAETPY